MQGTKSYVMLPDRSKIKKGDVINRLCIGLPRKEEDVAGDGMGQTQFINEKASTCAHKNPCHHYLFEMEDKKHNLDRIISQLRFLQKRHLHYISQP